MPPKRNVINLPAVNRELDKWLQLKHQLTTETDADSQTILDTCEGETELYEILTMMAEEMKLAEQQEKSIRSMEDDLAARKKRLKNKQAMLRAEIQQAMETAGVDTIQSPTITLSVSSLAPPTIITDEPKIPARFWKRPDPVLDRVALNRALKDGEEIPGATLGNPALTLSVSMR